MQEVSEEYFNSEEFLLSKVEVTQADIQYRGMVFTSRMLCSLFEAITGHSVEEAENVAEFLSDEKMAQIKPEVALFHIVNMIREVSEKGSSLGSLLIKQCSH